VIAVVDLRRLLLPEVVGEGVVELLRREADCPVPVRRILEEREKRLDLRRRVDAHALRGRRVDDHSGGASAVIEQDLRERSSKRMAQRWTWLIIRDAFLGLTRFAEFRRSLMIAPNVLAERLNHLVEHGVLERILYCEHPARYEYRLTERGEELFTALNALRQWGDRHLSASPMRLLRTKAGKAPVVAALVVQGAPVLGGDEIELVPGPGFPRDADPG
jgi:DNA-binding HxlR family transcriptional regulator